MRSAWRASRAPPALGAVEDAELDAGFVGRQRHRAAQRIDFLDQMALADAADRRVAAHLASVSMLCVSSSVAAPMRPRQRGLGAGMAAADDDHVELFGNNIAGCQILSKAAL